MLLVRHVIIQDNWFTHPPRLHVEADQVTNVEREKTKRVVYAVVYGVGEVNCLHV